MNWKLVEKGFRKLISDGFIEFSLCLLIYLTPEKESIVNWAVKRHAALGQISTIIFGISCHGLIRRKQNRYIRYTPFCENIFQNRRYVFFDIQHHGEIENFDTLNDNLYIESSDLIFEIGAGRGMTTQIAAQRAKHVVALEPSPRGFMCASSNLKDVENVELFQYGA